MDPCFSALGGQLRFNLFEVGAREISGERQPVYYSLLNAFPGSQLHGFEVDPVLCAQMNAGAPKGVLYHPCALGRREEERAFYETEHPACSSLYRPNWPYARLFQNLEVMREKKKTSLCTVSLDYFTHTKNTGAVDFIKIDIQGAELEVFEGGVQTLKDVLLIVAEVEFVPLYENQPLFGDVCAFLSRQDFSFHKFQSLGGRAIKPLVVNNDLNTRIQHLWADAIFFRDLLQLQSLGDEQLLKLAVLLHIYRSNDVAHFLLNHYDQRKGTQLAETYRQLPGQWGAAMQ